MDLTFLLEQFVSSLTTKLDRQLKANFEITYSEWRLLMSVFLAQKQPTQEEIARYAGKTPAAVSRQLNHLEEMELVERSYSKTSKREKHVVLTRHGKSVFNKSLLYVSKHTKGLFSHLAGGEARFRKNLLDLTDRLADLQL